MDERLLHAHGGGQGQGVGQRLAVGASVAFAPGALAKGRFPAGASPRHLQQHPGVAWRHGQHRHGAAHGREGAAAVQRCKETREKRSCVRDWSQLQGEREGDGTHP